MSLIKRTREGFSFEKKLAFMGYCLFLCACSESVADSYLNKMKPRPHQSWFAKINWKPLQLVRDPFHLPFKDQSLFPLKKLHFKGLLQEENRLVALIQQPDEQILFVQIGDKLGVEHAQVMFIQEQFLQVKVGESTQKIYMD